MFKMVDIIMIKIYIFHKFLIRYMDLSIVDYVKNNNTTFHPYFQ